MSFENISRERRDLIEKGVIAFLIVITAFFVVKGISEMKRVAYIDDEVPTENTITVHGEGETFVVPDIAEFTFSVTEEADSVASAQEAVTERSNDIVSFLEEHGIEEDDIKTVGYNIHPRYEYRQERASFPRPPSGERVLVGYEVSQTTRVKVRDTSTVGELLSGVGERDVSNVSGISFTVEDEEASRRDARAQAIQQAKENANELANDLGVRLGDVVSFNESGDQPRYFLEQSVADGRGGADDAAQSTPQISPGENRVVSQVNITYEIR